MKTEFLKELGLEKEAIDKIMAENGKDIESYKTQVTTLTTDCENAKEQLITANKKIEEFKGLDVDGIKKAADDYKEKYEAVQKESAEKMATLKFEHALDGKLGSAKAKDVAILKGLLKNDDLKLTEDGNILGLDEQISKLKKEKDYLFEPDDKTPQIVKGTNSGAGIPTADSTLRAAMGLPSTNEK